MRYILILFFATSFSAVAQNDSAVIFDNVLLADTVKELVSADYSSDVIKVVLPKDAGTIKTVKLTTLDGKTKDLSIESLIGKDENITIHLARKLKSGNYFITVTTTKGVFSKKLTVN